LTKVDMNHSSICYRITDHRNRPEKLNEIVVSNTQFRGFLRLYCVGIIRDTVIGHLYKAKLQDVLGVIYMDIVT